MQIDDGFTFENSLDAEEANCRDVDPDLFFLDNTQSAMFPMVFDVCARCVIAEKCLEFSLTNEEEFGIWGGAGPSHRKRIRREKGYKAEHIARLLQRGKELNQMESAARRRQHKQGVTHD